MMMLKELDAEDLAQRTNNIIKGDNKMLNILFIYKESDLLSQLCLNILNKNTLSEDLTITTASIEDHLNYINKYDLYYNQTLIFTNLRNQEVYRHEGPFNKGDFDMLVKKLLPKAKLVTI